MCIVECLTYFIEVGFWGVMKSRNKTLYFLFAWYLNVPSSNTCNASYSLLFKYKVSNTSHKCIGKVGV